jgi:hypothetical protein
MTSLLVLGSKPDPALPPRSSYDALACANASGRSAAVHGLPAPTFTVMSAVLTSGKKAPNVLALEALRDLRTETLYFYPRPECGGGLLARVLHDVKTVRMQPWYFRWTLRRLGYQFARFVDPGWDHYHRLVLELCHHDAAIRTQIERKQPSTGMIALALGLAERRYERLIVSGFSFEITHAYADNPLIAERRTATSKHAETDVALLRHLAEKFGNVYTTEPTVHARAGVPYLEEAKGLDGAARAGTDRMDSALGGAVR